VLYTTTLPAYTDETTTADEIFCDRFGDREHDNSQAFGASVHSEDDDDNERPKRTSIDCKYRATPTPSAIAASMVVEANDINDTSDRDTSRASLGFAVAQSSQRAPGRTVGIELGRRALALRAPPLLTLSLARRAFAGNDKQEHVPPIKKALRMYRVRQVLHRRRGGVGEPSGTRGDEKRDRRRDVHRGLYRHVRRQG